MRMWQKTNPKKTTTKVLWVLSIGGFIFSLTAFYISISTTNLDLNLFFSTDAITNSVIYKDLMLNSGTYKDWYFPYAPSFLPEFAVHILTQTLTNNFVTTVLITSILLYTLVLLSIYFLYTTVFGQISTKEKQLFIAALGSFNILLATGAFFLLFLFLLLPQLHVGAVAASIISIALCWKVVNDPKPTYFALLIAVTSLATFSDRLYIFFFVIPVSISLLLIKSRKNKQTIKRILTYVWLSTIIGFSLYFILIPHPYPLGGIDMVNQNTGSKPLIMITTIIKEQLLSVKVATEIYQFKNNLRLIVLANVLFIIALISMIKIPKGRLAKKLTRNESSFLLTYLLTQFVVVAALTIVRHPFENLMDLKFFSGLAVVGLFGFIVLAILIIPNKIKIPLTIILSVISIAFLIVTTKNSSFEPAPPPKITSCLDGYKRKYGLERGIAMQWFTGHVTMFSGENLRIVPVSTRNGQLEPYPFITDGGWFFCKDRPNEKCEYNFVVLTWLDTDIIYDTFGEPKHRIFCGKHIIAIYEADQMTPALLTIFKEYFSQGKQRYL